MSDQNVEMKVSVTGMQTALADLQRLRDALSSLNGNSPPGVSSGSHAPAGAPAGSIPAPNPYAGYASTNGYGGAGNRYAPPGYFAPHPSGSNAGNGAWGGGQSINVASLTINAASVNLAGGGGSNGGGGYGGGGGYNNPYSPQMPSWNNRFQSFAQNLAQNPSVNGLVSGGIGMLSMESMAAAGIAGVSYMALSKGLSAAASYSQPSYDLSTQLAAAGIRGEYVSPASRAIQEQNARLQGALNVSSELRGLSGPLYYMGLPGLPSQLDLDRQKQRQVELNKATIDAIPTELRHTWLTGNTTLPTTPDETRKARYAVYSRMAAFGRRAARAADDSDDYSTALLRGYDTGDEGSAAGVLARLASNPRYVGFRNRLRGGRSNAGNAQEALALLASQGDFASILELAPFLSNGTAGLGSYQDTANSVLGLQNDSLLQGYGLSGARARYQSLLYSGTSATGLRKNLGGQSAIIESQIANAESRAAIAESAGDATTAAQLRAEVESLKAQRIGVQREAGQIGITATAGRFAGNEAQTSLDLTRASLFKNPGDIRNAGLEGLRDIKNQESFIQSQLSNASELKLTFAEILSLQRQLTSLKSQELQTTAQIYRTEAASNLSITQGRLGISSTEQSIALMRGTGGLDAVLGQQGVTNRARQAVSAAQAQVDLLKRQGVSESNEQMVAARQQLASAQASAVQADIATASQPFSLGLRRELSREAYQIGILTNVPGAYGNVRSSLQNQVQSLERAGRELAAQKAAALAAADPQDRAAIEAQFQEREQALGLEQAQAIQQLSYGWESRLTSEVLGQPGSFGGIANRFSLRDAVGMGVRNPHFGANAKDRLFFESTAMMQGSLAGSIGTPAGFRATALTGARANRQFGGNTGGRAFSMPGATDGDNMQTIRVVIEWPDGREAGRVETTRKSGIVDSTEDLSNLIQALVYPQ